MIVWPYRLILRGVVIERQREAAAQLAHLRLQAVADGMDQGREYVDPEHPDGQTDTSQPHYSLRPYQRTVERLERLAEPWHYSETAQVRRREREEEAAFERFERAMGGLRA
ncbi:hypothetical protein DEIPH_ctg052orf0015 [Deinococcus phoenicis]|uniref:Uncharacterized protein n=1 Tax=Deinococcus phoenicis TaxID=1476583 RepID=A0A016QLL8_9DEIO|nr:hypothetical protein [Deinococcus phoenicis]EYB67020.1 hypothetical protein DEIPH_ctg052orf0015 [Deinococcus phoenicis]